jgi:hypothetical protein
MKLVVILFLVAILGSLGSALFYLVRDKGGSDRTVRALTFRVGISVTLFLLLMIAGLLKKIAAQHWLAAPNSPLVLFFAGLLLLCLTSFSWVCPYSQ